MAQVKLLQSEDEDVTAPGEAKAPEGADVAALLADIPAHVLREAWFTMAHLVLDDDARVLEVDCGDGTMSFVMAVMNPHQHFTAIGRDRRLIKKAQDIYQLPNLQFMCGDITENFVPKNSIDAVINSYTLHEIYSGAQCNEKTVTDTLAREFELLKTEGVMFIRDFAMPDEEYVLLEMPDEPSRGKDVKDLSEVELLILYAEQARPRHDQSYRGFYLEELPPRFPRTRLFRLPAKWAHEFVLRKDDRENWKAELQKEYTFFTEREYRRTLRAMGSRVLYTAPNWDEQIIKSRFDKKFKLFDDEGTPMGPPPTSFIAVAQKIGDKKSLVLQERKPSRGDGSNTRIIAMRDNTTGKILDVVTRDIHVAEILPYRITEEGRLKVFIHEGLPRSIINAVPRNGPNLDGKKWSGHMTEAIAIPLDIMAEVDPRDIKTVVRFGKDYLGLKPELHEPMADGPGFYPAPDYIDERIETKFIRVEAAKGPIEPKVVPPDIDGFSTRGRIREVDAQSVLNAVGVGFVPTSRLEIQVLALFDLLEIPCQPWSECPLTLKTEEVEASTKLQDIISKLAKDDKRYKEVKGTCGQLRTLQSVFVDEGQSKGGELGLASRDMDFVISEEHSLNTAVVLPLTRKINGEIMAGIVEQYLPVPQRYKGTGYMINVPSLPLPKDITNIEQARRYIAEKFEVPIECVARMGESFFSHIGVTPHRIYPFAVSTAGAKGWRKVGRTHGPCHYAPLYRLYRMMYLDNYYSFMKVVAMAYKGSMGIDSDLSPAAQFSTKLEDAKSDPVVLHSSNVESFKSAYDSSYDKPSPKSS